MPGPLDRGWGATVVVASGPSFSVEQAEQITAARAADRCRVIVVSDNYLRVPNADVLYSAGEGKWYDLHIAAIRASGFVGELWTQDAKNAAKHGLHYIESKPGAALLPIDDLRITQGSNSGFQAMMLARLFRGTLRPEPIIIVGFDMQRGANGRKHWFGDHPSSLANGDPRAWIKNFNAVAPLLAAEGTLIKNATISTALTCFERADLTETLATL